MNSWGGPPTGGEAGINPQAFLPRPGPGMTGPPMDFPPFGNRGPGFAAGHLPGPALPGGPFMGHSPQQQHLPHLRLQQHQNLPPHHYLHQPPQHPQHLPPQHPQHLPPPHPLPPQQHLHPDIGPSRPWGPGLPLSAPPAPAPALPSAGKPPWEGDFMPRRMTAQPLRPRPTGTSFQPRAQIPSQAPREKPTSLSVQPSPSPQVENAMVPLKDLPEPTKTAPVRPTRFDRRDRVVSCRQEPTARTERSPSRSSVGSGGGGLSLPAPVPTSKKSNPPPQERPRESPKKSSERENVLKPPRWQEEEDLVELEEGADTSFVSVGRGGLSERPRSPTPRKSGGGIKVNLLAPPPKAVLVEETHSDEDVENRQKAKDSFSRPMEDGFKRQRETSPPQAPSNDKFEIPSPPRVDHGGGGGRSIWEYPTPAVGSGARERQKRQHEPPTLAPPRRDQEDYDGASSSKRRQPTAIPPPPPIFNLNKGDTIPLLLAPSFGSRDGSPAASASVSRRSSEKEGRSSRERGSSDFWQGPKADGRSSAEKRSSRDRSCDRSPEERRRSSRDRSPARDRERRGRETDLDEFEREFRGYHRRREEQQQLEEYQQEFSDFRKGSSKEADRRGKEDRMERKEEDQDGFAGNFQDFEYFSTNRRAKEDSSRSSPPRPNSQFQGTIELNLPLPKPSVKNTPAVKKESRPKKKSSHDPSELPPGWSSSQHVSGTELFFHSASGVVSLSRPYLLESGVPLATHPLPNAAVPPQPQPKREERRKSPPPPPRHNSSPPPASREELSKPVEAEAPNIPLVLPPRPVSSSKTRPREDRHRKRRSRSPDRKKGKKEAVDDVIEHEVKDGDVTGAILRLSTDLSKRQVLLELCQAAYPDVDPPRFEYMEDASSGPSSSPSFLSRCLFRGSVVGHGFGRCKTAALEDACAKALKCLEPGLPADKFCDNVEQKRLRQKMEDFYRSKPMRNPGPVHLFADPECREDARIRVLPTQLVSALLSVAEADLRCSSRFLPPDFDSSSATAKVEASLSVPKSQKGFKYVCEASTIMKRGTAPLGEREEELLRQLAAHQLIVRYFAHLQTWWDAVSLWLDWSSKTPSS